MIAPTENGLNIRQWARWRKDLLITGGYNPNEWHRLSSYQKEWTNDTKNTMRALTNNI
jgi:hypothetical protein